jgi:hypothetical protein
MIEGALKRHIERLGEALDVQIRRLAPLEKYREGNHPIPDAVSGSNATNAYRMLMGMSRSNWPGLIVDSVEERLEVQGFKFSEQSLDAQAWTDWQANSLDADSGLVHDAALTGGKAYAIVWGDGDDNPVIVPEHGSTTIVEYAAGSRTQRVAALRRWRDGEKWFTTLYLPDGIYKFESKGKATGGPPDSTGWQVRQPDGESWPLPNPLGVVPVIEIGVNRSLKAGTFGNGKGEFEAACEHIDRINYAMFSALAAMTWSGFPLRAQIGDPIVYEDDNVTAIQPFKVSQDRVVQIENPDGKLVQLPEASLDNYNKVIEMHVKHLAAITKTPAHYLLGEMVNLSADAIRAAEAGLISKIRRHHRSLGEGWEEVMRVSAMIRDPKFVDSAIAVQWADPESRSMAERADAAVKLANILPWQALCEKVLGATPQEISKWEGQRAADGLNLIQAGSDAADGQRTG